MPLAKKARGESENGKRIGKVRLRRVAFSGATHIVRQRPILGNCIRVIDQVPDSTRESSKYV